MNMKHKNQLSGRIMRRVYFIWFSKRVLPYIILEGFVFAIFMYLIGQNVYVAKVMQYAVLALASKFANPLAILSFALDIFIRTRLVVQISVLGSLLMIFFIFKNFVVSIIQLALTKEETNLSARML